MSIVEPESITFSAAGTLSIVCSWVDIVALGTDSVVSANAAIGKVNTNKLNKTTFFISTTPCNLTVTLL